MNTKKKNDPGYMLTATQGAEAIKSGGYRNPYLATSNSSDAHLIGAWCQYWTGSPPSFIRKSRGYNWEIIVGHSWEITVQVRNGQDHRNGLTYPDGKFVKYENPEPKETNPTKVSRFEILCLDGQWRPVSGTSNQGDRETGCRVCACSETGKPFEAYGQIAADKNLAEFQAMAHPQKVRFLDRK